jgi:PAS domain S-box-containing protein
VSESRQLDVSSSGRILVVCDEAAEREALEALLAGQGYTLAFSSPVSEALLMARSVAPDLVLLAAGPGGPALCRQVRADPLVGEVPILVVVAQDARSWRVEALGAGADDFVIRPFDEVAVQARVRSLVRLGHLRRQVREQASGQQAQEALWESQRQSLVEEVARRERQLLTLQSAGAAITSSLNLQIVLDAITWEMAHLLEMKACTISQWNPESRTLRPLARYDPEAWGVEGRWTGDCDPADLPSARLVLQERRARQITVDQAGVDVAELAFMKGLGIQTVLKLPMLFQDQVLGLVEVMDDLPGRRLTAEEITLTQLLANQAASAIENARLYDAIRRHVAEVTTLNKISQVIASVLDLHETLAIIADHAHWLLDVAAASVILYDKAGGDLWFGAASGEGADFIRGKRLEVGRGIVNWVIQHGQPLVVPNAAQDPRHFSDWDRETGFRTRSILCVPLQTQGRTIGAIEAINKASGPFDDEDLTLLRAMAASAAIAIENARLYEQAQQEINERKRAEGRLRRINRALRTLGECHDALVRAQGEGDLLREVCRILVDVGGHRLAWVGSAEQDAGKRVRVLARAGHDEGYLDGMAITWADVERGRDPTGTAIRTRKVCVVKDVRSEPGFAPWRAEALKRGYASAVALPLVTNDEVLGVLSVYAGQPDAFDGEEFDLLRELANDLALGIVAMRTRAERDRAEERIRQLYEELQDHASKLEGAVAERTRELQAERDRTQAILEAVGEAVIVTDLAGTIQYLNPAAVELTGYTVAEALGRSPRQWQYEEASPGVYAQHDPAATETQRAEVVSRRKDGVLYDAAMTVAPLFDSQEAERLVGHVCVQRDITPIKDAERLKDQFVSNVSHELRTPLSIITLISGNLERLYGRLSDERRRKLIRDIRDQAQILNDLINDVLEISRIESGRVSMEREWVDLAVLASEEVGKQLPLAQKKAQALHVFGDEDLVVLGHADQLRQVVRNLLNNAIKYTPNKGRITCECRLLAAGQVPESEWPGSGGLAAGRWAALRVVDTGIGISPEELPRLYERFYRVKTQGNIPGTGLGLSIVQELIELHSGHIGAASTPGEGSIFAVYVPLREE